MKFVTTGMFLLLSLSSHAMSLSYKEHVTLKKIKVAKDLPVNLFKLYHGPLFEDARMIAGKFDTSQNFRLKANERCFR